MYHDMNQIWSLIIVPSLYRKRFKHRKKQPEIKKKIKIDYKKVIFIIVLIFLMIFFKQFRKAVLYVFFILITGYITYYSKLYHLPIDVSPLFFLEIVITRYYGIKYTLLFILIAYFGPKMLAGHAANWRSYAFIAVSIIANIVAVYLPNMGIQTLGYLTSVIQYIGGIFITMTMKPFYFAAADGIANVTNNLLYFLIFSEFIVLLF